ncbi:hypothetical protein HMPREF9413_0429 [Paenibacillus sp. HGF7]|nr:hypothetical protein HMPREF9413_0429 [Paenibacillus sp. HGF7]
MHAHASFLLAFLVDFPVVLTSTAGSFLPLKKSPIPKTAKTVKGTRDVSN